jgi:hypothetical protein
MTAPARAEEIADEEAAVFRRADSWSAEAGQVSNCRQDLLDHVIVLNELHLKRLMNEYVRYYHDDRTRLALACRS